MEEVIVYLSGYFDLRLEIIVYQEVVIFCIFVKFIVWDEGIVGGVGQCLVNFGFFGIVNRIFIQDLWLVGDLIYLGEGIVGVFYLVLIVV